MTEKEIKLIGIALVTIGYGMYFYYEFKKA